MNIHKNARLTLTRRLEMVQDIVERKLTLTAAAGVHGVSVPTVRKWVGRYLAQGEAGLMDLSSRPRISPRAISAQRAFAIVAPDSPFPRQHWQQSAANARLVEALPAVSLG